MWTKELRRHKGRTAATVTAVAIAMALLVSMLTISEGIIATVESSIRDSGADLLVGAPYDANFPAGHAIAANLSSWQEVEFASPALQALVTVSSGVPGTTNITPLALGVIPDEFLDIMPVADHKLIHGWFGEGRDPYFESGYTSGFTGEVVLSTQLAASLQVESGSRVTVYGDPSLPAREFTVVGTIDTLLSSERIIQEVRWAFFHLSELQVLTGDASVPDGSTAVVDRVNKIYVALTDKQKLVPEGAGQVQGKIEAAYPDFGGMVQTKQDRLDRLQDEYVVARVFYTAIGFVSLVIGLLFVACVVTISVAERMRDIGALRAIGVGRRSIFSMILAESLLLVAIGAVVGVAPAYLGAQALGDFVATSQGVARTFISFSPELVLWSIARVVAFGTIFSLYPAWKATRIPVVDALRAAI